MSSTQDQLRQRIFDLGVNAAGRLGAPAGFYPCPLCGLLFGQEQLDRRELTLEDVPPKTQGGRPITLTCKRCNNTGGSTVDVAAMDVQRLQDFAKGLSQKGTFRGTAKMKFQGHSINVLLDIGGGRRHITFREGANNPAALAAAAETLHRMIQDGSWVGSEFDLTPDISVRIQHARVGDLRTAFLAAFAVYGYAFALHHRLSEVRRQIERPDQSIFQGNWHRFVEGGQDVERYIIAITNPVESIVVRLGERAVHLPCPMSPDNYLDVVPQHQTDGTLQYTVAPWPDGSYFRLDLALPASV